MDTNEVKEVKQTIDDRSDKTRLFGNIKFISGNVAHVANIATAEEMGDLMNVHVVFEAKDQFILGEVEEVTDEVTKIRFSK